MEKFLIIFDVKEKKNLIFSFFFFFETIKKEARSINLNRENTEGQRWWSLLEAFKLLDIIYYIVIIM